MTTSIDILTDAYGRIQGTVHRVVDGLDVDQLAARVDLEANSVAWLVWHLTRVQDSHVADAAGSAQVWHSEGWAERFALPFSPSATGYGQSSDEVGAVRVAGDLLLGYFDATHARSLDYLGTLTDDDLDRIVDTSWNPPVTLAVRLLSVVNDDLQHAGQAAFARGVIERRG